jgi:ATP-dependent helicase/nuclease subunit B
MDETAAARCEELREMVMEPLLPFLGKIKSKKTTAREKTEALYELIVSLDIQRQLAVCEKQFEEKNELAAAKEYSQIYAIVMELLEKVVDLLGNEAMSLREYTEILEAGFEEAKVGIIPPTADRVTVGDIERTRLKDIKALIFLGLNDGWVPKGGGKGGILSEPDRDALEGCGVELAPGARENGYIQRFYLYQNLTKPKEKLLLSYSKAKPDGGAMRPSYLINTIRGMYKHIQVVDEDLHNEPKERIATPENGIPYLIRGLKDVRDGELKNDWAELFDWYLKKDGYKDRVKHLVEATFLTKQEGGLGSAVAKALYGSVLENSVSRLEKFAACSYAHFLLYGLKLKEREEYTFQPVDMGNVFHKGVELFSEKVANSEYTWFDLPKELQEEWSDQCVEEALDLSGGQVLLSSARNSYVIRRIKRIMRRTIWALCKQVQAGSFQPANYEVSFSVAEDLESLNIALSEKEKMRLRGRIDRIDTMEKEDAVYVKVIDYKSGSKEFDLVALYYGLQLQLVVYMNAAMELEKKVYPDKEIIPAGIFYYRMNDPMLDRELGESQEYINQEILKKLKLSGLVNEEKEVIDGMDKEMGEGKKASDVIPVSYTSKGFSKYSSVADREQFAQLSDFVNEKMKAIGKRILEGETEASPYQRKGQTACDYCDYREICGFDTKIPGTSYRRLREYDTEKIWKKIEGEE